MRWILLILALFTLPARADDRVDLNRAGVDELQHLPGIGPAKAKAIVDERDRNGPFSSVEDLDRVKGIGASIISKLKPIAFAGERGAPPPKRTPAADPPPRVPDDPPIARPPPPVPAEYEALDKESPEGKINLNLASEEDLLALAGMSLAHAKVIVAWRKVKGPFHHVGELLRVPGLPKTLVQTIVYFVTTRVDAAKATEAQLVQLGVSTGAASTALSQRRKGALKSVADVDRVPGLTEPDRDALRGGLWFAR